MKTIIFTCAIIAIFRSASLNSIAQNQDSLMPTNLPPVSGYAYRCENMVQVVNALRHLGKDKALSRLRNHLRQSGTEEQSKILLICRALFVNPKGWDPEGLGMPMPRVHPNVAAQFPSFPIAFSEGVPFLLTRGYNLDGRAEVARISLELCQKFDLIRADLPLDGYDAAAHASIDSPTFRQLYQRPEDAKEMAEMILRQAQVTKPLHQK